MPRVELYNPVVRAIRAGKSLPWVRVVGFVRAWLNDRVADRARKPKTKRICITNETSIDSTAGEWHPAKPQFRLADVFDSRFG